ncbi:MAG TPA: triose-phosphate isomerase [Telmatospirillum sp.]|nr:triose-phosphate isomerase [Telmatospirillum sp.]
MRRKLAGTGWKMNIGARDVAPYAQALRSCLAETDVTGIDIFVLPPFTSLSAAAAAFAGSSVAIGGQNMHWEAAGAWTGEVSAPMLVEAGCRYVELAHSERLQHFGETYPLVRRKVDHAMTAGLIPIICLGETKEDKDAGRADAVIADQMMTALAGQSAEAVPGLILAYEPRWAIGAAEAASPLYVAARHKALRGALTDRYGRDIAERTRILYGGSVTAENGSPLIAIEDVDGLFVGRAAWSPEGFSRIVKLVAAQAAIA